MVRHVLLGIWMRLLLNYKSFDLYLGVKWWMVDLVWSWMVALRRMPKQNLCWIGMFQTEWLEGKYQVSINSLKTMWSLKVPLKFHASATHQHRHVEFSIFNICFDFFHCACLQETTSNIRYSKFDMFKSMSCRGQKCSNVLWSSQKLSDNAI